jgi:exodeoxyribonuclease III
MSEPTVIVGDLNTAVGLSGSTPSGQSNHMRFVDLLRDQFGLVSAYHAYYEVEHGHERHNTYFHYKRRDSAFHIDYCFIPNAWLPKLKNVKVGLFGDWIRYSDHVPLVVEFGA